MRAAVAEVAVEGGGGPRTRKVPLQIPSLKKQLDKPQEPSSTLGGKASSVKQKQ